MEIILFRIIQEFFSNTNKYSEANNLIVTLNYTSSGLIIIARDDGNGFDEKTIERGSGLINMKSRAELIHTAFNLVSQPKEGVTLTIRISILT